MPRVPAFLMNVGSARARGEGLSGEGAAGAVARSAGDVPRRKEREQDGPVVHGPHPGACVRGSKPPPCVLKIEKCGSILVE